MGNKVRFYGALGAREVMLLGERSWSLGKSTSLFNIKSNHLILNTFSDGAGNEWSWFLGSMVRFYGELRAKGHGFWGKSAVDVCAHLR